MKGKELRRIIDRAVSNTPGLKIGDIIEKSGIPQKSFYRLFEKDEVDMKYLEALKTAGINVSEIVTADVVKPVPVYDIDATAGNVTIFNEDRTEYIKSYVSVPAFADCDMFITISGNSMYPKFCSGEMVALKRIEDLEVIALGEAYIVVTKEQRMLKYIRKATDKAKLLLVSEHPDYDPFEIDRRKILHLYIVKGKITKTII